MDIPESSSSSKTSSYCVWNLVEFQVFMNKVPVPNDVFIWCINLSPTLIIVRSVVAD